jgi:hypothetical protein
MNTPITHAEREQQVSEAYISYFLVAIEPKWSAFMQSKAFLSIPPATDELRERIETIESEVDLLYKDRSTTVFPRAFFAWIKNELYKPKP